MSAPTFLRPHTQGVLLSLKVHPRASVNQIVAPLGDELRVKVTAPPVDAQANEAVMRLLADILECPRNQVELLRGQTSRHKVILLRGWRMETVVKRLAALE